MNHPSPQLHTGGRFGWHRLTLLTVCTLLLASTLISGCRRSHRTAEEGVLVASATLTSAWVRNFNPFSPNALWPTRAGIYEPLLIFNSLKGDYEPWLADSYSWHDAGQTVDFTIRETVKWSDGHRFSADDVQYTFDLIRDNKALDTNGVWSRLRSVTKIDHRTIRFVFKAIDYPALPIVAHQMIVPAHIWRGIPDPVKAINPNPVATGPFTEVTRFRTQLFELGQNPHYWRQHPAMPKALRMPAYSGNDTVSLALVSGDIDWAGHMLPLIEKTYVARDPKHFHYWFPPFGGMVFLYANTQRPPLSHPKVRKALSVAIDRAQIVRVGMSDYTKPADGTALSPIYDRWRCCGDQANALTQYNPDMAQTLLREAGCVRDGGWSCDGKPLTLELEVVNGWSDWIRTAQLVRQKLSDIGIEVTVRTLDFGAWFDRVQRGDFDLSIGWANEGSTPYDFYRGLASSETRKPVGTHSPANWHRYSDDTFDRLLQQFARTAPGPDRLTLVHEMQRQFLAHLPAIPLFPNPSWGTFSTRFFDGFPDAKNPYAKLTPHAEPERLLVLTGVRSKGQAP